MTTYTYNAGYSTLALGSPIEGANIDVNCLTEWDGNYYWVVSYRAQGELPQWAVIDLTAETVTVLDESYANYPKNWGGIAYNGFFYVTSQDPVARMHKIDLEGKTITHITPPADSAKYWSHVSHEVGGKIYIGRINNFASPDEMYLYEFDPSDDSFTKIADLHHYAIDTAPYIYSLGVNPAGTYCYCCLQYRQTGTPTYNYLCIVKISDGSTIRVFDDTDDGAGAIYILKADGNIRYYRNVTDSADIWYEFETNAEAPTVCAAPSSTLYYGDYQNNGTFVDNGNDVVVDYHSAVYGIATNIDLSWPSNMVDDIVYSWDDGTAYEVTEPGSSYNTAATIYLSGVSIAGDLGVFPYSYISPGKVDSAGAATLLGPLGYSIYNVIYAPNGKYYIAGYASLTVEYDPTLPWDYPTNPSPMDNNLASYHYHQAWMDGGYLWTSAQPRTGDACLMGWYNVANSADKDSWDIAYITGGARPYGMVSLVNYDRIAALWQDTDTTTSKIYVFNKTDKTTPELTIDIAALCDGMVNIGSNYVMAYTRAATSIFRKVNCLTGDITTANFTGYVNGIDAHVTGAASFTKGPERPIYYGPDGYVYFFAYEDSNFSLCRLEPAAMTTEILDNSFDQIYKMCFSGTGLYLFG